MYIFVLPAAIEANAADGGDRPTIQVKDDDGLRMCREVYIHGPSKVVYDLKGKETVGARVWIETDSEVELII